MSEYLSKAEYANKVKSTFNLDETHTGDLFKRLLWALERKQLADFYHYKYKIYKWGVGMTHKYIKAHVNELKENDAIEFIEEIYANDELYPNCWIPDNEELSRNLAQVKIYNEDGSEKEDDPELGYRFRLVSGYRIVRGIIVNIERTGRKVPHYLFTIKVSDASDDYYKSDEIIKFYWINLCHFYCCKLHKLDKNKQGFKYFEAQYKYNSMNTTQEN